MVPVTPLTGCQRINKVSKLKITHSFKRDELIHLQKVMMTKHVDTANRYTWVMVYALFAELQRKVNKALLDEQVKYSIGFSIAQAAAFNLVLGGYTKEANDPFGIALIYPMTVIHDKEILTASKPTTDGQEH